jgi:hypothetical protein
MSAPARGTAIRLCRGNGSHGAVRRANHHYLTPNAHVITPAPGPGLSVADRQRQPTAVNAHPEWHTEQPDRYRGAHVRTRPRGPAYRRIRIVMWYPVSITERNLKVSHPRPTPGRIAKYSQLAIIPIAVISGCRSFSCVPMQWPGASTFRLVDPCRMGRVRRRSPTCGTFAALAGVMVSVRWPRPTPGALMSAPAAHKPADR